MTTARHSNKEVAWKPPRRTSKTLVALQHGKLESAAGEEDEGVLRRAPRGIEEEGREPLEDVR